MVIRKYVIRLSPNEIGFKYKWIGVSRNKENVGRGQLALNILISREIATEYVNSKRDIYRLTRDKETSFSRKEVWSKRFKRYEVKYNLHSEIIGSKFYRRVCLKLK